MFFQSKEAITADLLQTCQLGFQLFQVVLLLLVEYLFFVIVTSE